MREEKACANERGRAFFSSTLIYQCTEESVSWGKQKTAAGEDRDDGRRARELREENYNSAGFFVGYLC